jgi:hypothetical protein
MKTKLFVRITAFSIPVLAVTAASAAPRQQAVAVGPCQEYLGNGKWRPCSTSSSSKPNDSDALARAAQDKQLGESAAALGDAAYARGDFKGAAAAYLKAERYQPGNVDYMKRRARALKAISGGLEPFRSTGSGEFDGTVVKSVPFDLPTVAAPTFGAELVRLLDIPIDLNLPANAPAKAALVKLEDKLIETRKQRMAEQDEDTEGLAASVAAVNEILKDVMPTPLTVDGVETRYRKHLLNIGKH